MTEEFGVVEAAIHSFLKLGKTSKGLASGLKRLGIKGYRKCKFTCPGAIFLHMNIPDAQISVDDYIRIKTNHIQAEYLTPEPIRTLLVKFDAGQYSELVMPDEETLTTTLVTAVTDVGGPE